MWGQLAPVSLAHQLERIPPGPMPRTETPCPLPFYQNNLQITISLCAQEFVALRKLLVKGRPRIFGASTLFCIRKCALRLNNSVRPALCSHVDQLRFSVSTCVWTEVAYIQSFHAALYCKRSITKLNASVHRVSYMGAMSPIPRYI